LKCATLSKIAERLVVATELSEAADEPGFLFAYVSRAAHRISQQKQYGPDHRTRQIPKQLFGLRASYWQIARTNMGRSFGGKDRDERKCVINGFREQHWSNTAAILLSIRYHRTLGPRKNDSQQIAVSRYQD